MSIRRHSLLALFVPLVLWALPLAAQETGSISGTLRDPDGGPLPGVAVTVDGSLIPATTTQTHSNGVYRFLTIPPAEDYVLTFRLQGFQEVVYEGLVVRVGGNVQINATLALAGVTEKVTVVGESPIIDVKKTGTGNNVTERYMQGIPSARDPWVMLEHTPGVQVSKQNVGGSESGRQSRFVAYGSKISDTVFSYDGAEVTGGIGFSDMYYDFDALEEIAITTGGNDPSVQTGGVRLNFVSRRGGDVWRGSARLYVTDGALQGRTVGDQSTGELVGNYTEDQLFPGYLGNSIDNIKDWGAEIGGPLVRDRLFVWGAFAKQDIKTFVGTTPDNTQLTNWHGKVNWHVSDKAVANFTYLRSHKSQRGVGASVRRPEETTQNLKIAAPVYTGKLQYAFNDNNYVEATFSHLPEPWGFQPQGGQNVQPTYEYSTRTWGGSYTFYDVVDSSSNLRVDGNAYLAGSSLDHEIKYGYGFRGREVNDRFGFSQGVIAAFFLGAPAEAWLVQDTVSSYKGLRQGLYAGDTISAGRVTINAGLRYDHQTSKSLPSAVAAHPLAPDLFPGVSFPGFDPGYAWTSLSPRFGMTYDLSGDSTTILRLSAARYYSQMDAFEFHRTSTTSGREIDFEWDDLNGNRSVDLGETGDVTWISSGWDPANPDAPSLNLVAETSPPWTNELIAGIEREVSRSFAVGGNFIYRKQGDYTWAPRAGEDDPSFWRQVTQDVAGYGALTVSEPVGLRANFTIYKQRSNFSTSYSGVELYLTRRFDDRWMANASFNFGQPIYNYDGAGSFTDPTNIERQDGRPLAFGSREGMWGAARWYFKSSGMYQLPGGVSVAGYFQVRDGYINPQLALSNNRANRAGRTLALVEDFGESRLPTYWNLDLRAEKTFDLAARGRLHLILDAFNVTNNDAILGQEGLRNSPLYGSITDVLQGRTIRFGARLVLR